jgi:hypothetical protein
MNFSIVARISWYSLLIRLIHSNSFYRAEREMAEASGFLTNTLLL